MSTQYKNIMKKYDCLFNLIILPYFKATIGQNNYKVAQNLNLQRVQSRRYTTETEAQDTENDWMFETQDPGKRFQLPRTDIKGNQEKLQKCFSLIKLYIQTHVPENIRKELGHMSALISFCETLYIQSPNDFVHYMKLHLNWFKVFACSGNNMQRDLPFGMWDNNLNVPIILRDLLKHFNEYDMGSRQLIMRIIVSIFSTYKVIITPKRPSVETITGKYTGEEPQGGINSAEIEQALQALGTDKISFLDLYNNFVQKSKWHFTSASGPNGNALWSSHLDAWALWKDKELLASFREFCELMGLKHVLRGLEKAVLPSKILRMFNISKPVHSKLHYIFEKGDKCRVIALGDYFTQEALNPLHETIFEILKNLEANDFTRDHSAGFEKVRTWSKIESSSLYSIDLSAATDRLPVFIQERILGTLLGEDRSKLWAKLVSDRQFLTPEGSFIKYEVGQPMGFKSSFAMLALTHHVLVQIAAQRAQMNDFRNYVIVGDDIVINSHEVSTEYFKLMKSLGVTINMNKTISPYVPKLRGAEFCSKLCVNGVDFSPLPIKLFTRVYTDRDLLPQLQNEMYRHTSGGEFAGESFWSFVSSFCNENDLQKLAILNGLPGSLSGLMHPFLPKDGEEFSYTNLAKRIGVSENDVFEFFKYVLVVDQIKRVDQLLRDSNGTLVSLVSWQKSEIVLPSGLESRRFNISEYVGNIMAMTERVFFHPVQEIARSEANRLSEVLSKLMIVNADVIKVLSSGKLQSIRTRLTKQVLLAEDTREFQSVKSIYNRRLLDKAIRLLISTAVSKERKVLQHNISIDTLAQRWSISVGIGQSVRVNPLGMMMNPTPEQSRMKLKSALKYNDMLTAMYNIEDKEARSKYHPGGRLSSSSEEDLKKEDLYLKAHPSRPGRF